MSPNLLLIFSIADILHLLREELRKRHYGEVEIEDIVRYWLHSRLEEMCGLLISSAVERPDTRILRHLNRMPCFLDRTLYSRVRPPRQYADAYVTLELNKNDDLFINYRE